LFENDLLHSGAPLASGMVLGALLGSMNGSVGGSVLGLSHVVSPRLSAEGVPPATRDAAVAVASTLGVLVPPSLVLITLSDAMLSAHTIGVTQTGRRDGVIDTQDIFHAALLPAGICFVLCVGIAWIVGSRSKETRAVPPVGWQQGLLAGLSLAALLLLLGCVAVGYFYAVEAAVMGATALLLGCLVSRKLTLPVSIRCCTT
jgi:TRAP-type C4-dicarboxylate transport system permease large subunit